MAPQADSTNAKQLIVGRIQQASNIMVAVGASPSIDALAAALALSLMLNKLDKHATAVFSGQVPDVMKFLNPEKTFENNVDSLRDFIISLDKEKADRLRYKLENDVVRIFITPYRTTITEKDLQFSQGDFNVDLVIALGVQKREDLDQAVIAHGRILHDAAVVTINANGQQSNLGATDWNDANSSSLCEMLVSLTEALQKPGLLDAQIANALLTGIVAATDRFSNQHTTPKVMTMSAQLMAAGANQQLVANNIQKPTDAMQPIPAAPPAIGDNEAAGANGELDIKHPEGEKPVEPTPAAEPAQPEPAPEQTQGQAPESSNDIAGAEAELDAALPKPAEPPSVDTSLADLQAQLDKVANEPPTEPDVQQRKFVSEAPSTETPPVPTAAEPDAPQIKDEKNVNSWRGHRLEPPTLGGSLSSTSEEALEDKLKEEEDQRNHQLLSHDGQKAADATSAEPAAQGAQPNASDQPPTLTPAPDAMLPPTDGGVEDARKAVGNVLDSQEFDPAGNPRVDLGSAPLSPEPQPYIPIEPPTSQTQPPTPQTPSAASAPPPTDANGLPIIPPMPSLPTEDPGAQPNLPPMPPPLPPLPGEQPPDVPPPPPTNNDPNQPPADPGQFKIPS